jgi:hypothetical protein
MKITPLALYKLVEADGAIVLMRYEDKLGSLQHAELVAGNIADLIEYLPVYLHERSHGVGIKPAHATALKGARIIGQNNLELVPDSQLVIAQ